MDTEQRRQRKRTGAAEAGGGQASQADVFDQLGNDAIRAQASTVEQAPEASSALDTASAKLGSSVADKREALGEAGQRSLSGAIDRAAVRFGVRPLDGPARALVEERVLTAMPAQDIANAKEEGKLDTLVCDALRDSALDARDEVVFTLQQLMQDEGVLGKLLEGAAAGFGPGGVAMDLLEFLAVELVDPADVFALAAYDHGDILRRLVIGDDALHVVRRLSPLGMRFGSFGPVLYQMVVDGLEQKPLPFDPDPQGRQDPKAMAPAFRATLLDLVTDFRSYRTMSA